MKKFAIINKNRDVANNAHQHFKKMFDSGKDFVVEFRPYKSKRSNPQNSYYWGVVIPICADFLGYSADEMHFEFASRFIPEREYEGIDGASRIAPRSTAKLNTQEFTDYIEQIRVFMASTFGCNIPDPM